MRVRSLLLVSFLTLAMFAFAGDKTHDQEDAAVRVPLDLYLKAHATGNPEYIKQAFWENAKITGMRDGKLTVMTRDEFAGRFNGKTADDEAKRKRRIVMLDRSGDTAIAKIELDYPNVLFYDYMTLHKLDGEWKIVNKSYQADKPKSQATK